MPNVPSQRRITGIQRLPTRAWASTARISNRPGTLSTSDGTAHWIRSSTPTTFRSVRPSTGSGAASVPPPTTMPPSLGAGPEPPGPTGPAPAGTLAVRAALGPEPPAGVGAPDGVPVGDGAAVSLGVGVGASVGRGVGVGSGKVGSG